MISPNIVDNSNIINATNIDNIIVIIIVNGHKDIRINSDIDIDVISNINCINNNTNDHVINNISTISNNVSSNSIMRLTSDKTTNSTNDKHNIIYIDMIIHHVNDIIINDILDIHSSSIIANNVVSINDNIVDHKTNSNHVKVAMSRDDVSTSTQGLFNNSCPYMCIYITYNTYYKILSYDTL